MTQSASPIVSEVAYIREQIRLQEEAAARALNNGAVSAPHEFVAHNTHKELVSQVGQDQAMQLLVQQIGWTPEEIAAGAAANQSAIDAGLNLKKVSMEKKEAIQAAIDQLTGALSDPDWQVRAECIQDLGEISQLIIAPIKAALSDPDMSVRGAALSVLGIFKTCLDTSYLLRLALDPTIEFLPREAAVTVLEREQSPQIGTLLRGQLNRELAEEEEGV